MSILRFRRVASEQGPKVQLGNGQSWKNLAGLPTLAGKPVPDDMVSALRLAQERYEALQEDFAAASEAPQTGVDAAPLLPLRPSTYRDFMLYEQHSINAVRGFHKRYLPKIFRRLSLLEHITGKPAARYRPKPIFYQRPIYYLGSNQNFHTDGDVIGWPEFTEALDYELELGVVLVRSIFRASPEEVADAIGGLVVFNDFSARDVQAPEMGSGFGPQRSKNFANAMSAEVVCFAPFRDKLESLTGTVSINGELVSRCSSTGGQFGLLEAISIVSQSERLHAGELFGSGTWPGGCALENGHWVKPGDTLTMAIDGIASLSTRIERSDEATARMPQAAAFAN
ncbi:MAG: fumarylacetoacetate hydrolase family protein [bacterium]|nr:fumarylacetoacetate hydrolase family protein [bacterium]